jgi:hypothetical protein
MLGLLKKIFGVKPVEPVIEVTYKIETPVVDTPVAVAKATAEITAEITAENKAKAVAKIKRAPIKKAPIKKAAAKAPRKPKTS